MLQDIADVHNINLFNQGDKHFSYYCKTLMPLYPWILSLLPTFSVSHKRSTSASPCSFFNLRKNVGRYW